MVYKIFYVSTASHLLSDDEIAEIYQTSRTNNQKRGITGALIFNGLNFGQVLEGNKGDVQRLLETIRKDVRHTGLIVVAEGESENRAFRDWTMQRKEGLDFQELFSAIAT